MSSRDGKVLALCRRRTRWRTHENIIVDDRSLSKSTALDVAGCRECLGAVAAGVAGAAGDQDEVAGCLWL